MKTLSIWLEKTEGYERRDQAVVLEGSKEYHWGNCHGLLGVGNVISTGFGIPTGESIVRTVPYHHSSKDLAGSIEYPRLTR